MSAGAKTAGWAGPFGVGQDVSVYVGEHVPRNRIEGSIAVLADEGMLLTTADGEIWLPRHAVTGIMTPQPRKRVATEYGMF